LGSMGAGVKTWKLDAEQARSMIREMKNLTGSADYHMDDLVCFLCLAKKKD
jgi:hypothetical protein